MEYQAGREPLQAAYFILTLIEASAGGSKKNARKNAAKAFKVTPSVLEKIGKLSSSRGDAATARKAPRSGPYRKLTDRERAWLEQVIPRLIKRLGEPVSGSALSPIRMPDFPDLTDD